VASDPAFLGQIHFDLSIGAMHATRARSLTTFAAPQTSPRLAHSASLQIFFDDDGLPGGDTPPLSADASLSQHREPNVSLRMRTSEIPKNYATHLDGETARFVRLAQIFYSQSLGPWWRRSR